MLRKPFYKEIPPAETPLAPFKAVSSCPVTWYQGEEANPHLLGVKDYTSDREYCFSRGIPDLALKTSEYTKDTMQ